ncbi:MAG TPA: hypothetical protein VL197_12175 [Nitrospirota bacterium]|nr:hypothetical protein [Nitrospirota bacterium]
MKTIGRISFIWIVCMLLIGCSNALLFSHTVEPLTLNPNPTEVRESLTKARGYIIQGETPFMSTISVRLGKNGLGEVAKQEGIDTIYYADLEKWSCCLGFWRMDVVHIYGR